MCSWIFVGNIKYNVFYTKEKKRQHLNHANCPMYVCLYVSALSSTSFAISAKQAESKVCVL